MIDCNQSLIKYSKHPLCCKDSSFDGGTKDAAATLLDTFRWAESLSDGKRARVPEIVIDDGMSVEIDKDSLRLVLDGRLTRATSGQIVDMIEQRLIVFVAHFFNHVVFRVIASLHVTFWG